MDVGEVDQRRHQIRIELQRPSIGGGRLLPCRLVAIVERRSGAEILFGQRGIARRLGGVLRRRRRRRTLKRRIFAGAASSLKSNANCPWCEASSERTALLNERAGRQLVVRLLDDRDVGKSKERIGVGPQRGIDEPALHEISQLIFAQQAVAREQIAHRRILPLHGVGRWHTRKPAELLFRHDFDRLRKLTVQFLGATQFVAFLSDGPKPSAPITSIVVLEFTSSAVAPPRRTTRSRAWRRASELSFPVKTTS